MCSTSVKVWINLTMNGLCFNSYKTCFSCLRCSTCFWSNAPSLLVSMHAVTCCKKSTAQVHSYPCLARFEYSCTVLCSSTFRRLRELKHLQFSIQVVSTLSLNFWFLCASAMLNCTASIASLLSMQVCWVVSMTADVVLFNC
jgi:hypothetical protein